MFNNHIAKISVPETKLSVHHRETAFVDEPFALRIAADSEVTIRVNGGEIEGPSTISIHGEETVHLRAKARVTVIEVMTEGKTYTASIPVLPPFNVVQSDTTTITCTGELTVDELCLNGERVEVPKSK